MYRIKTKVPNKSNRRIVRISNEYTCEIIYSYNLLCKYSQYTENKKYDFNHIDFCVDKAYKKIQFYSIDTTLNNDSTNHSKCLYSSQNYQGDGLSVKDIKIDWYKTASLFTFILPDGKKIKISYKKNVDNSVSIRTISYLDEKDVVVDTIKCVNCGGSVDGNLVTFNLVFYEKKTSPFDFTIQYTHYNDLYNIYFDGIDREDKTKNCFYSIYDVNNSFVESGNTTWSNTILSDGITERFCFDYTGVYDQTEKMPVYSNLNIFNKSEYDTVNENSHILVFRRNNFTEFNKKMGSGYPFDTYGTSLFIVTQSNTKNDKISLMYSGGVTRWNKGEDCFADDLTNDSCKVIYNKLKQITGLTDIKFKNLYDIWKSEVYNFGKNTIDIPVEMNAMFGLNSNQEDLFNNDYVNNVIEESINKPIDYEKRQFVMNYLTNRDSTTNNDYVIDITDTKFEWNEGKLKIGGNINDDDNLFLVNNLTFDLYFRDRNVVEQYIKDGVNYVDFGDWETGDENYWFDQNIEDNGFPSKMGGDLLGNLGFNDDDVYYQKDSLKKSFLRLSVYDSPHREIQKLLCYSTLFFDTNVLYKKYVDFYLKNKGVKRNGIQYVFNDGSELKASFTCANKFKQDASSDGFYLYLFDKVVEGDVYTTLYLKVEFNNAKTGKTVPLMWPGETDEVSSGYYINDGVYSGTTTSRNWGGNGSKPYLKKCPVNYVTTYTENGKKTKEINSQKLLNDLYIPIGVKYNFKTNEYNWFIINHKRVNICPNNDGNIKLVLFEPRINE